MEHFAARRANPAPRTAETTRANGSEIVYAYEATTSRLKTMTDAKAQVTTYSYDQTGALTGLTYANEEHTTPDVTFAYEAAYGRLASMVDGTGTTTYSYHPTTSTPQLGAGQLHEVDGPLSSDVIAYTYDELGRVTTRAINGSANTVTWAFDALGRVTSEVNVLGTFGYTYDGTSPRLATVTYPNSQTSSYAYFGSSGDHRLQTIHHKYPNGSTLSKFDYTYDAGGNILTWRQQADASAVLWEYGYDGADQLLTAVKKSTDPTPQILQRFAYTYDPAGNRTAEQIDDAITTSTYNNMNQLVSQAPGGLLRFEGTLDEAAAVTIDGKPALVTGDNRFVGHAAIGTGTSQIEVRAIDPNGNIRVNTYEVSQAGSAKSFAYDANGNMIGDGARTFEWDARDQILANAVGTRRLEFEYNGARERVSLLLQDSGFIEADTVAVWCDGQLCEERSLTAGISRQFSRGEVSMGSERFFGADHLGSVREVTDSPGALLARFEFDPWGRASATTGAMSLLTRGFGTLRLEQVSGLWLAQYRTYDAASGRWTSEDPARFVDGPNLFSYVTNRPLAYIDPAGLQATIAAQGVVPTPNLPTGCAPTACGCTKFDGGSGYSCGCTTGGQYQLHLWAFYRATIYVNTNRWTPRSLIESHERGHIRDYKETTSWFVNQSGGLYPSASACESAGRSFKDQMQQRLRAQAIRLISSLSCCAGEAIDATSAAPPPARSRLSRLGRLAVGCFGLVYAVACGPELTAEEKEFYSRASEIHIGASVEAVRQSIGEPSKVLDASDLCVGRGGHKEWLYDSFETVAGKRPLRAGFFTFCIDQSGKVVGIVQIQHLASD